MNEIGYEIDFLPVGEGSKSGDSIVVRWGKLLADPVEQTVIVIDGGYTNSGEAIVSHIRNHYKTETVDCVINTHPDNDHVGGLRYVLENLKVANLLMHCPWHHTDGISSWFKDGRVTDNSVKQSIKESLEWAYNLEQLALRNGVKVFEPFTGMTGFNGVLRVLGPTREFYDKLLLDFKGTPEPKEISANESMFESILGKLATFASEAVTLVGESLGIETLDDGGETSAENESSAIILLTIEGKHFLFTGDAGIPALDNAVSLLESEGFDFGNLGFIQVPHHGSKRNIGPSLLDRMIGPKQSVELQIKTAFVSSSKEGAPKHPSKKVTNAFRRRGAHVFGTCGIPIFLYKNAPDRGWGSATSFPMYNQVEE